MAGRSRIRWKVHAAVATLSIIVAAAIVFVARFQPDELLARHLLSQLDSIRDDLVDSHVRQIEQLDVAGSSVLVKALGNPRPSVTRAANLALHRQLDRWQSLPSEESSGKVALIARQLALHVGSFEPAARAAAGDLALRLLRWPLDAHQIDRVQMMADCEKVVRASADKRNGDDSIRLARFVAEAKLATSRTAIPSQEHPGMPPFELPGGDLPMAEAEVSPLPRSLINPPKLRPPDPNEPRLVLPAIPTSPRILFGDDESEVEPGRILPLGNGTPEPDSASSSQNNTPEVFSTSSNGTVLSMAHSSHLELMRGMQGDNSRVAVESLHQLIERGFSDLEISLGRQMTSPDVMTRRRFAESLVHCPVDPSRWLVWSSHDPDPGVRLIATSMMATTRDPTLDRRLSEMLQIESNERVREQLERWSRARSRQRR